MSSVVQFNGVAVEDIRIGAAVVLDVDVTTGRSTVSNARQLPPAAPVLTEPDGTEWYVKATDEPTELDTMAAELLEKLSTFRWPPPQPEQVRGLVYAHMERAQAKERARIAAWLRDCPPAWDERVDPETVTMWAADEIATMQASGDRMTKPHEETWTAKIEPTFSENDQPLWMVVNADDELVADCTTEEASARLLAQAPAMARLLLAIETIGVKDGATMCCPVCNGGEPYAPPKHDRPTHTPDCEWVRVLRAAGVLP